MSPIPPTAPLSHKRQGSALEDGRQKPRVKRRKRMPSWFPGPKFWDGLPNVLLTDNALMELERRNAEAPKRRRRSCTLTHEVGGRGLQQQPEQFTRPASPLRRFASHGGPDLSDLRGYSLPYTTIEMSVSSKSSRPRKRGPSIKSGVTSQASSTKSLGPYDGDFQSHLIDHGILPDLFTYNDGREAPLPENLEDIRHMLTRSRRSLSPSRFPDDRFKEFRRADDDASKESEVVVDVIPIIVGPKDGNCIARQVPYTNLQPLTDGTITAATPDLAYGARFHEVDSKLREMLSGQIRPFKQGNLMVAPNFFIEVKGPDGAPSVAQRQLNYAMAMGERAQVALLTFADTQPIFGYAHTMGYTYQTGHVKMYAIHCVEPKTPRGKPEYVMTQVNTYALTGNATSFRQGVAACRNAKEWAKQQRDLAIAEANKAIENQPSRRGSLQSSLQSSLRSSLRFEITHEREDEPGPAQQQVMASSESHPVVVASPGTSEDELTGDFQANKRTRRE